jgi:hypothetical protein
MYVWINYCISKSDSVFTEGYGGGDRATDGTYGYDELNATHHYAPKKILLATEGCNCPGVNIDDWLRAERLAHDVMFDLQNYAQVRSTKPHHLCISTCKSRSPYCYFYYLGLDRLELVG